MDQSDFGTNLVSFCGGGIINYLVEMTVLCAREKEYFLHFLSLYFRAGFMTLLFREAISISSVFLKGLRGKSSKNYTGSRKNAEVHLEASKFSV